MTRANTVTGGIILTVIPVHISRAGAVLDLVADIGILVPEDPSDLAAARALAQDESALPLGILYHNPDAPRYDIMSAVGLDMGVDEKLAGMNKALDNFAI